MSSGLVLVDVQTEFRCVQGAVTQAKAVPVVTTGLAHHTAGRCFHHPKCSGEGIPAQAGGTWRRQVCDGELARLCHPLLRTGISVCCVVEVACLMIQEQKRLASYSEMIK